MSEQPERALGIGRKKKERIFNRSESDEESNEAKERRSAMVKDFLIEGDSLYNLMKRREVKQCSGGEPLKKGNVALHAGLSIPWMKRYITNLDGEGYKRLQQSCRLVQLVSSDAGISRLTMTGKGTPLTTLLKDNVVGLYIFNGGDLFPDLRRVYKQCMDTKKRFKVVVVNVEDGTEGFEKIKRDRRCGGWWCMYPQEYLKNHLKSLIHGFSRNDGLIVIMPSERPIEQHVDIHGAHVVQNYGVEAYPFKRESIVEGSLAKMKGFFKIKWWFHDNILSDFKKMSVSLETSLSCGRALLYIGTCPSPSLGHVGARMLQWYFAMKAKDRNFEVIQLDLEPKRENIEPMPWLVCKYNQFRCTYILDRLRRIIPVHEDFEGVFVAFDKHKKISFFRSTSEVLGDAELKSPVVVDDSSLLQDMRRALGCDSVIAPEVTYDGETSSYDDTDDETDDDDA